MLFYNKPQLGGSPEATLEAREHAMYISGKNFETRHVLRTKAS